jgi:hypothetical protein
MQLALDNIVLTVLDKIQWRILNKNPSNRKRKHPYVD